MSVDYSWLPQIVFYKSDKSSKSMCVWDKKLVELSRMHPYIIAQLLVNPHNAINLSIVQSRNKYLGLIKKSIKKNYNGNRMSMKKKKSSVSSSISSREKTKQTEKSMRRGHSPAHARKHVPPYRRCTRTYIPKAGCVQQRLLRCRRRRIMANKNIPIPVLSTLFRLHDIIYV